MPLAAIRGHGGNGLLTEFVRFQANHDRVGGKRAFTLQMIIIIICRKSPPLFAAMNLPFFSRKSAAVKLAISPEILAGLVEKGQLHAADFRCLDLGSKQIVWKMLLTLALAKSKHDLQGDAPH